MCLPETPEGIDELYDLLDLDGNGIVECVELANNFQVLAHYVEDATVRD